MKLTNKEKLYLFEIAFDDSDDLQPDYSEKFESIGISKSEFDEMNANKRLRRVKMELLRRASRKWSENIEEIVTIREEEEEFKITALLSLYNSDNPEIYPELAKIRPLVRTVVDKYFANQDLTSELNEIRNLKNSENHSITLIAKILFEFSKRWRDIRQCVSCHKLFIPTPQGHGQIYCSNACKVREYRRRKQMQ